MWLFFLCKRRLCVPELPIWGYRPNDELNLQVFTKGIRTRNLECNRSVFTLSLARDFKRMRACRGSQCLTTVFESGVDQLRQWGELSFLSESEFPIPSALGESKAKQTNEQKQQEINTIVGSFECGRLDKREVLDKQEALTAHQNIHTVC